MTKLAPREIAELDPCKFMAATGKRVIRPGGRASTDSLVRRASSSKPRMARAVPYLGDIVVAGTKPR